MASTYTPIATQTVSAASSISFTSIPSTYTDIKMVFAGNGNSAGFISYVKLNNDSGVNYSSTHLIGTGVSPTSAMYTVGWVFVLPPTAGSQFNFQVDFMNYANTSTYKTWLSRESQTDGTGGVDAAVGLWRSTAAINRIDIVANAGSLTGTVTLYGIKAA